MERYAEYVKRVRELCDVKDWERLDGYVAVPLEHSFPASPGMYTITGEAWAI